MLKLVLFNMTIEEIKEKILSVNRVNGWLVECDICKIDGDIQTGNCSVFCDVNKSDFKKKRQYIEHWHYSFSNGRIDEFSFISGAQKKTLKDSFSVHR